MVKDQHPQAVKEATASVLPVWLDAFRVLLSIDPLQDISGAHWDGLSIKIEVFKVCFFALLCHYPCSREVTRLSIRYLRPSLVPLHLTSLMFLIPL